MQSITHTAFKREMEPFKIIKITLANKTKTVYNKDRKGDETND